MSELDDLLADLTSADEYKKEPEQADQPEPEPKQETQLVKRQESKVSKPSVTLDMNHVMDSHEKDYQLVMDQLKRDRSKIDHVISILSEKVDSTNAKSADTEALVSALNVMANTNTCVVRVMDSRAKMVSALKGHITKANLSTNPSGGEGGGDNLMDMLDQAEDEV